MSEQIKNYNDYPYKQQKLYVKGEKEIGSRLQLGNLRTLNSKELLHKSEKQDNSRRFNHLKVETQQLKEIEFRKKRQRSEENENQKQHSINDYMYIYKTNKCLIKGCKNQDCFEYHNQDDYRRKPQVVNGL